MRSQKFGGRWGLYAYNQFDQFPTVPVAGSVDAPHFLGGGSPSRSAEEYPGLDCLFFQYTLQASDLGEKAAIVLYQSILHF